MRIEWNDDLGRPTDGPIYWKFYRLHAMSARLLFWSANDGWPIDPREEFLQVKFIQLKLFMPAMGHASMGLYPHVEAVLGRVGQFKVTNIHFVMLADTNNPWEVRIQLKTSHDDPDFDTANDSHIFSQAVLRFTQLERR